MIMDKVVLGFAPTRRAIFSAPAAVEYRGLTAKRLKELNVDFVAWSKPRKTGK